MISAACTIVPSAFLGQAIAHPSSGSQAFRRALKGSRSIPFGFCVLTDVYVKGMLNAWTARCFKHRAEGQQCSKSLTMGAKFTSDEARFGRERTRHSTVLTPHEVAKVVPVASKRLRCEGNSDLDRTPEVFRDPVRDPRHPRKSHGSCRCPVENSRLRTAAARQPPARGPGRLPTARRIAASVRLLPRLVRGG